MTNALTGNHFPAISHKVCRAIFPAILFLLLGPSILAPQCYAADETTIIVSETLGYSAKQKTYTAAGSVKISRDSITVEADEIVYIEETGDVTATGNVRCDDLKASFTAKKAEMNMAKKTGKLYDADIFFKDEGYYLKGAEIEQKSENEFYSKEPINVTTCDGPVAAWCIQGREMHLVEGEQITGRDISFRLSNVPLFYFPYIWAPLNNDRKTGFLIPSFSSSSSRGIGVTMPFYWAIAENSDATITLDAYSRRGIGAGLEYRHIGLQGLQSYWWLYHIRDRVLNRDFTEFRALHDDRLSGRTGLLLNANVVSKKDFYRETGGNYEKYVQRFLESAAEVNIPFEDSRAYLLAQYWIDLKHATGDIAQKLPELGYVMNYKRIGSLLVSAEVSAVNFWRKDGVSARRLALYPTVLHSVGSDVVLSQILALRGTAYQFYNDAGADINREKIAIEYDGGIHARLFRKYDSFTHIIEPTIRYHYISETRKDLLHIFDDWEIQGKTSRLEISLLNRVLVKGREIITARITQPIDMDEGRRAFQPVEFELAAQTPAQAKVSAVYDVKAGKIQAVSSDVAIPFSSGSVSFGQRYNRPEDIMVFRAGIEVQPVKPVQFGLDVRYDAKGKGLRQAGAYVQYAAQCWGVRVEAVKKPGDFSVRLMFDLYGVTAKRPANRYEPLIETPNALSQEISL